MLPGPVRGGHRGREHSRSGNAWTADQRRIVLRSQTSVRQPCEEARAVPGCLNCLGTKLPHISSQVTVLLGHIQVPRHCLIDPIRALARKNQSMAFQRTATAGGASRLNKSNDSIPRRPALRHPVNSLRFSWYFPNAKTQRRGVGTQGMPDVGRREQAGDLRRDARGPRQPGLKAHCPLRLCVNCLYVCV